MEEKLGWRLASRVSTVKGRPRARPGQSHTSMAERTSWFRFRAQVARGQWKCGIWPPSWPQSSTPLWRYYSCSCGTKHRAELLLIPQPVSEKPLQRLTCYFSLWGEWTVTGGHCYRETRKPKLSTDSQVKSYLGSNMPSRNTEENHNQPTLEFLIPRRSWGKTKGYCLRSLSFGSN